MISDALITAAHKIDVPQRTRRHKGRRLVVMSLLVTAAASAAAAVAMRGRQYWSGSSAGPAGGTTTASEGQGYDIDRSPDPDMNGDSGQRNA
jgi:hypothetical protein